MTLFINDEEAKRRLEHETNLVVKHKIVGHGQSKNGGRPADGKNISPELKSVIGTIAKVDGVKNTAEAFNMNVCQVGAYKDGKKSDRSKPDIKLRELQEQRIEAIHEKITDRILKSLTEITDEKVEESSYAALTKGAVNLAGVLDRLRGTGDTNTVNQQFVFYGVRPREEEAYKIIEVETPLTS